MKISHYKLLIFVLLIVNSLVAREYIAMINFEGISVTEDEAKALTQSKDSTKYQSMQFKDKRINLSVGIGDNRSGMNIIGLSYKIFQKDNNEAFLGIGTAVFTINTSLGWKHYFSEKKKTLYTALSIQAITRLIDSDEYWPYTGISLAPTISAGMENEISKTISSQLGLSIMGVNSDTSSKMVPFPYWVISLIFRI